MTVLRFSFKFLHLEAFLGNFRSSSVALFRCSGAYLLRVTGHSKLSAPLLIHSERGIP